jgi:hypothetical protein
MWHVCFKGQETSEQPPEKSQPLPILSLIVSMLDCVSIDQTAFLLLLSPQKELPPPAKHVQEISVVSFPFNLCSIHTDRRTSPITLEEQ